MKILHIIPTINPLHGGVIRFAKDICEELARLGNEVHIATTNAGERDSPAMVLNKPLEKSGVVYRYFNCQTEFYKLSLPMGVWLAKRIREYDFVHIHCLFSYPSVFGALIARMRNTPYTIGPAGVFCDWGMLRNKPLLKKLSFLLLERHCVKGAKFICYTSEKEMKESYGNGVRNKGLIFPAAIELRDYYNIKDDTMDIRKKYGFGEDNVILLFMGRFDRTKGLDLLVHAFKDICKRKTNVILVIAGQGERRFTQKLCYLLDKFDLRDKVILPGFLQGKEKIDFLFASDIFLMPSYSENFGIAAVEAMACAKPLIVTDKVGISTYIKKYGAGIVIPCKKDALKDAMLKLIDNQEKRENFGKAGKRLAENEFSIEKIAKNLVSAYNAHIRN